MKIIPGTSNAIVLFQRTILKGNSDDLDFCMFISPLFPQSESSLQKAENFLWTNCQQTGEILIQDQKKKIRNLTQLMQNLWAFFMGEDTVKLQYLINQQSIH